EINTDAKPPEIRAPLPLRYSCLKFFISGERSSRLPARDQLRLDNGLRIGRSLWSACVFRRFSCGQQRHLLPRATQKQKERSNCRSVVALVFLGETPHLSDHITSAKKSARSSNTLQQRGG